MSFLGRKKELKLLNEVYNQKRSVIFTIYGRRRIGKSHLIKQFATDKPHLFFEGLERQALKDQIEHFSAQLKKQIRNSLLQKAQFRTWEEIFDFLTQHLATITGSAKQIIFFDELPWMASSQNKLISLLKYYWDNHWSKQNVMLILCGSVSSFMVRNVIHSKALYGRISFELHLKKMEPQDALLFFKGRRGVEEILKYLLLFGGVPKYLEEINLKESLPQNIQRLCFNGDGFFVHELEKIFYSHFREKKTYAQIIQLLAKGPADLKTIGEQLDIPSGGGLKGYLDNLEASGFIGDYLPFNKARGSKLKRYKLHDEFILFYFKFIRPYEKSIHTLRDNKLFTKKVMTQWQPWLGLALENFCLQNAQYIADKLGFAEKIESFGPYFERGKSGFQIDLIYKRFDNVITLCEIKYLSKPVGAEVIADVERKIKLLKIPKGFTLEKVLIAPHGADSIVQGADYFHQILTIKDLF